MKKVIYQIQEYLKAKNLITDDTYKVGVIASGDIFLTDKNMSKKINSKFNALCVEMEGASIGMVCSLCHVPFLIIRSISDVVGLDNKISYEEFLEKHKKCDQISSAAFPLFRKIIIEIELIELSKRHTVTGTQLIHPGIQLRQVLPGMLRL